MCVRVNACVLSGWRKEEKISSLVIYPDPEMLGSAVTSRTGLLAPGEGRRARRNLGVGVAAGSPAA